MEKLFNKLNDNAIVGMSTALIDELICEGKRSRMNEIYNFFLQMKVVDKNNLNDKNLARLNALELLFEDANITFEKESRRYKKHFLHMLQMVLHHKALYEEAEICNSQGQNLAQKNIQELTNVSLDELHSKFDEYVADPTSCDSQVAFILKIYLKGIEISKNFPTDVQNWQNQFVVYGKISASEVEQYYNLDHDVLEYFNALMTQKIRKDLHLDDVAVASIFIDEQNQVLLLITKQKAKQEITNIRNKYLQKK